MSSVTEREVERETCESRYVEIWLMKCTLVSESETVDSFVFVPQWFCQLLCKMKNNESAFTTTIKRLNNRYYDTYENLITKVVIKY